jgi:hypothetical protein
MTYLDLVTEIKRLSPAEQLKLLAEISQSLASGNWPLAANASTMPARLELLQLTGSLPVEDAAQMREAVEEACEQVNANEW